MRFWIFGGFTLVWCCMWWYVYTCHIKTCCSGASDMRMGYEFELDRTLSIGDSSGNLIPHDRYTFYRDSILALLTDDRKLIVRGIYGPGESMTNGLRRAETVLKDFAPSLEQDRYEIYSKGLGERSDLQAEVWVDNREVDTAQQVKSDVESPSSLEIE